MFNGYNETPLISYNEFGQERGEKKQENVPKWSYGHDAGGHPAQPQPNNRHSEFWSGKPNFLGIPNVLKCSCASCYPSSENQSYQGDSARHRPWLPRTFSVPLNGSNEPCKLPTYQWDNGLSNQGACYPEGNLPYAQESGGKYPYYRHYQNSRLPEANQPGVITSVKNGDYAKKPKNEIPSPIQNGGRQPILCNPAYNLSKRVDGRNYCDPNEKYSNLAPYHVDQQASRLPAVEPFIKAVPSNLSQNRVPSTGYRSVKENMPQQYIGSGFGDARKIVEQAVNGDKRCEAFPAGQLQTGLHLDYSYLNRDLPDIESQKLFFDNTRHPDYYSKNNFHDVINRNSQAPDGRKDCAISQMSISEQHYNLSRTKYQEAGNSKPSYEVLYAKDFEKSSQENHPPDDPACFQRNGDGKTENASVRERLPRSALLFNDPRFADRDRQNSFPYQSSQAYGNYLRTEHQSYSTQPRYKYPTGFQDFSQYRVAGQQMQSCEQLAPQQGSGFVYDVHCQQNVDKTQQFYCGKSQPNFQNGSQASDIRKPPYLEAVRIEEVNKNGTSKISPLRLLRKKKFINVPQETAPASTFDAAPGLDVRKFWSTWAEEEEENVAPTQMVVLDCQNIDPEQAKLLHLYEADPVRAVHLESGSIVIKNAAKEPFEEMKASEQHVNEPEVEEETDLKKQECDRQEAAEKAEESRATSKNKPEMQSVCQKALKKEKPEQESRGSRKAELMDKWTEKKFDFLKRAEESKAAEILRHEEEKKKILETRISLQQTLIKTGKAEATAENAEPETTSPFDENSLSDSAEDGNAVASELPTSEYRRNKFLDYSEKKVPVDGKDEVERDERNESDDEPGEEEMKKETSDTQPTEKLSPSLKAKLKEEPTFEMDDILRKMSEMNFQNAEIKTEDMKKPRGPPAKKPKNKKSNHQPETDDRADKLRIEAGTKPTIKFSIQKSHDLKISFKVLNNGSEYSDEDAGGRDGEADGNAEEDSKNSTELITLKYKSIQGDGKQNLGLKKRRKALRRKKEISRTKTPTLKLKQNRYAEEQRDPLADDGECLRVQGKQYSNEYLTSDDFQVKETVDSAKIKLTFKRHRGNKINSSNVEKISEVDPLQEERDGDLETKTSYMKKARTRKSEIFAEPGVETFQDYQQATADEDSDSETQKVFLESAVEDSRNSSTSQDSYIEKENFDLEPGPSPEDVSRRASSPSGEGETRYVIEDSKSSEETNKRRGERGERVKCGELAVNPLINCEDGSEGNRHEFSTSHYDEFPEVNTKESSPTAPGSPEDGPEKRTGLEKEEIEEISLDFIKSTKSQEIETNHKSRKTEETENVEHGSEAIEARKCGLEKARKSLESSSETQEAGGCAEHLTAGLAKLSGSLEISPENISDVDERPDPDEYREIPPFAVINFEDENAKKNMARDGHGHAQNNDEGNEVFFSEKIADPVNCEDDGAPQAEPDEGEVRLDLNGPDAVPNLLRDDSKCDLPSPETSFPPSEACLKEFLDTDEDEKPEAQEPRESGNKSEESGHLGFDLPIENPSNKDAGLTEPESCRLETAGSDVQKLEYAGKLPVLSLPEKMEFESFDDDQFSRAEVDTKDGNEERKGNASPPDNANIAHSTDFGHDKLAREGAEGLTKLECVTLANSAIGRDSAKDSGYAEGSFPADGTAEGKEASVAADLRVAEGVAYFELEEGEIVDSPDETFHDKPEDPDRSEFGDALKKFGFTIGEVERRHSTDSRKPGKTSELQTWSRRKFSKARSCPPGLRYSESVKEEADFSVEDIPLPTGPPPLHSFFNFKKRISEAKKEREESISAERRPANRKQISLPDSQRSRQPPFGSNDLENCRNPSPPTLEKGPSCPLGIFQRSSKIKFSFSKRSKFSKIGLKKADGSKIESVFSTQGVREEHEKREAESPDFEKNKKVRTPGEEGRSPLAGECKIEEARSVVGAKEDVELEQVKVRSDSEQPVELCESLDETVEVLNDFIREEFYECEDVATSEHLTDGDDLEIEKVNDDKFRNIMQNCIDNAKKFLNIGNLKLFSCSVDDLLELDSRTTEENEPEKPGYHVPRDVLLGPCDDPIDDLDLPENVQPPDISMDFVPSFSSDVCPEILPVDNWPYLEEEVPSSPTTSKEDETDLIPPLENAASVSFENQVRPTPKTTDETEIGSFRRRSVVSDVEASDLCSKIGARRRNTIDCFTPFGKNFCDIKNQILRLKGAPEFEKGAKCRLSLRKLENDGVNKFSEELENGVKMKSAKTVDYKSPSWQPRVMLFRISKNELRKVLKNSKACKRFASKTSGDSPKISGDLEAVKKRKSDFDREGLYENPDDEIKKIVETLDARSDETLIGLTPFIKGSLTSTDPYRKKKKSRFRNLHTKKKTEPDKKDFPAEETQSPDLEEPAKTFTSFSQAKHPKELVNVEEDEGKLKKKQSDTKADNSSSDKRFEKDAETPRSCSYRKIQDEKENRHREKRHDRGDRRGERDHKQRHRHGERHGRRGSGHDRSRHAGRRASGGTKGDRKDTEKCGSSNGEAEKATKVLKEVGPEARWACEVCGFNDAAERIVHIKSHPFHCQSCHLAFKTETRFVDHLTEKHKDIRNQHHCLLCELSFDTEDQYQKHLDTREHRHLEAVEKNTINTLFTLLTGAPCPVLGIVDVKPEWLPSQAGTVHFYHQATPLSLALQYLKMHRDLSSFSTASSAQPG